jgi:hypothetical protein
MPIADVELDKLARAYLLRPASETVFTALRAWRSAPDSYEWWWLVIQHDDQLYTAIRFAELRDLLVWPKHGVHMNTPLADLPYRRDNPNDPERPLPGVVSPNVVDGATVQTARALEMTQASPGQVLIVLQDGKFRGILGVTSRTFAFADKPLLDLLEEFEMGGESETIIVPRAAPGEDTVVDEPPGDPRP